MDERHDLSIELRVLLVKLRVLLQQSLVGNVDLLKVVLVLAVCRLQLRVLDLHSQKLFAVFVALLFDEVCLFGEDLHVLLELDLGVQLLTSEALFHLQLFEHALSIFVFELETKLESGDLFTLGLKLESLLVGLSNASTLELMFHFHVLLVHFALFRQNLEYLTVGHVALPLQVLNARVRNRYVNVDLGVFREQGTGLSLLPLQQGLIVETPLLLVFLPALVNNVFVKLGKVSLVLIALFLHLLVDLVALAGEVLLLLDGTVGLSVLLSQLVQNSVQLLLLIEEEVLGVLL